MVLATVGKDRLAFYSKGAGEELVKGLLEVFARHANDVRLLNSGHGSPLWPTQPIAKKSDDAAVDTHGQDPAFAPTERRCLQTACQQERWSDSSQGTRQATWTQLEATAETIEPKWLQGDK